MSTDANADDGFTQDAGDTRTLTDAEEAQERVALARAIQSMLCYAHDASYRVTRWERTAAAAASRHEHDAARLAASEMRRMAASTRSALHPWKVATIR